MSVRAGLSCRLRSARLVSPLSALMSVIGVLRRPRTVRLVSPLSALMSVIEAKKRRPRGRKASPPRPPLESRHLHAARPPWSPPGSKARTGGIVRLLERLEEKPHTTLDELAAQIKNGWVPILARKGPRTRATANVATSSPSILLACHALALPRPPTPMSGWNTYLAFSGTAP